MNFRDKVMLVAAQLRAASSLAKRPVLLASADEDGGLTVVDGRAAEVALAGLQAKALSAAAALEEAVELLTAFDVRSTWLSVKVPPQVQPGQLCVSVLAVVDDPRYRLNGDEPFIDIANYWPEGNRWTVTHLSRASDCAVDYEVRVVLYRPLDPVPTLAEAGGAAWG